MADSIGKKVKGFFMSKKKKTDDGNADKNAGFGVLNSSQDTDSGSQAAGSDEITDVLDTNGGKTPTEAPVAPEPKEKIAESKAEKAHEKVSRIAAEKNTKGYGL